MQKIPKLFEHFLTKHMSFDINSNTGNLTWHVGIHRVFKNKAEKTTTFNRNINKQERNFIN